MSSIWVVHINCLIEGWHKLRKIYLLKHGATFSLEKGLLINESFCLFVSHENSSHLPQWSDETFSDPSSPGPHCAIQSHSGIYCWAIVCNIFFSNHKDALHSLKISSIWSNSAPAKHLYKNRAWVKDAHAGTMSGIKDGLQLQSKEMRMHCFSLAQTFLTVRNKENAFYLVSSSRVLEWWNSTV